ncbi:MAG: DUF4384 domain-containing protein [Deltaproteobacteria bacterium]|nr:DUF4384 domain-containing protein [Deltaproteobacteria bacterium]
MNKGINKLSGVLLFLSLIVPALSFASPQPRWLKEHMAGTFELPGLYYGIGSASFKGKRPSYEEKDLAKDRAVNDLSYRLSVSVKSTFREHLAQRGEFPDQDVESSLFVTTRLVLSGVEIQEDWTDTKENLYWVVVTIDKEKADRQVRQQSFINEVVDRLEGKQDEVIEGIEKIEGVLTQRLKAYEYRMDQLGGLLETIDSKIEKAGDQTKNQYAFLQKEIKRLEQIFQINQKAKMKELMRQNKVLQDLLAKISHHIDKDYFLSLAQDDLKHQTANLNFRVNIEPDKGQGADYYHGEKIRFRVHATRGCYIKVIYLSSTIEGPSSEKRMNTLLFPNKYDKDNWISTGKTIVIGRLGELEILPPYGKDVVTVVASKTQFSDLEETLQQARGKYYSEVTSSARGAIQMRSRGIEVVQPASSSETGSVQIPSYLSSVATDTCFIVSLPR